MIAVTKKIKVQLNKKVGGYYTHDGQKHVPGEVFEIPAAAFRPHLFQKIEAPKPAKKLKPQPESPPETAAGVVVREVEPQTEKSAAKSSKEKSK